MVRSKLNMSGVGCMVRFPYGQEEVVSRGPHMGGWGSPSAQVSTGPDSGHMGPPPIQTDGHNWKHSSRVRTGCFCGSGVGYLWGGYTLPPQIPTRLEALSRWIPYLFPRKDMGPGTRDTYPPPPALWTHKHLWKHYLPAASLAGGKNVYDVLK